MGQRLKRPNTLSKFVPLIGNVTYLETYHDKDLEIPGTSIVTMPTGIKKGIRSVLTTGVSGNAEFVAAPGVTILFGGAGAKLITPGTSVVIRSKGNDEFLIEGRLTA